MPTAKPFPMQSVLDWLRDHDWPIPEDDLAECTFDCACGDIAFLRNEAASIRKIYQLRPIPGLANVIFLIAATSEGTPHRSAIRRIATHFSSASRTRATRSNFVITDMLFVTVSPSGDVYVSHFSEPDAVQSKIADIGPFAPKSGQLVEMLHWDVVSDIGFELDDSFYVRHRRKRSADECTASFVEFHAPDQIMLFKQSYSAGPIDQPTEDRLFRRAKRGDKKALALIVHLNLRKVFDTSYSIFRAYAHCNPSFDDIYSAAVEGLLAAVPDYRPDRANRFATYCWSRVYRYGIRGLITGLRPFTIPAYVFDIISPTLKACSLDAELRDQDSDQMPSEAFNTLDAIYRELAIMLMCEPIIGVPERAVRMPLEDSVQQQICAINDESRIAALVDLLTPREADVFLKRAGFHPAHSGRGFTLDEIGEQYNLTRERIRQIELRATKKLRKALAAYD